MTYECEPPMVETLFESKEDHICDEESSSTQCEDSMQTWDDMLAGCSEIY